MVKRILVAVIVVIAAVEGFAQETRFVFPEDAGVLDVTKAPYNADNTGVEDATSAIQAALSAYPNGNRTIYLPDGTYLISNTLEWPEGSGGNTYKRTMLQGESMSGTIIKLKDNCEGFHDPENTKAMVYTGPAPAQRFRNAIRGITFHTGTGNPGASGVQFNCSNEGTMQHVAIISGDGQGVNGLDLDFVNEIGPGYIYDLTVEGFDYGVKHGRAINSMTFEKITVRNQNVCGFFNGGNVSPIRGFTSDNKVTAVIANWVGATTILLDADLSGGVDTVPAIINRGTLYARNLNQSGYGLTIQSESGLRINMDDPYIKEYNSHALYRLFPSPVSSLNLPVKDWPEVPWSPLSEWANVRSYGAVGDGSADDRQAIQDAIDSGKETVYFPGGFNFKFNDTVRLRGNVRRIIGCEGKLTGSGTFLFEDDMQDVVVLERLNALYASVDIVYRSSKTLVVNSVTALPVVSEGSGDMFLINNAYDVLELRNPAQSVWVRQLNLEDGEETNIINDGAKLWILGYKTEKGKTKIHTMNGGMTELLGSHNYSTSGAKTDPWFIIENASVSIVGARETNFNAAAYTQYVKEIREDETSIAERSIFPSSGLGAGVIPLFVGHAVPMQPPDAPANMVFEQVIANNWQLSWDPVSAEDMDYYSVYMSEQPDGPYLMTGNYLREPDYLFEAPVFGDYYFRVTAVDDDGFESESSASYQAVVTEPAAPAAPSGLNGEAGDGFNRIYWNSNTEPEFDHYELYRALPPGTFFVPILSDLTDTIFMDSSLVEGKSHLYSVKAVNVYGKASDFSDTLTIFPLGDPLKLYTNHQITAFPNPVSDIVKIRYPTGSKLIAVTILDISGKVVRQVHAGDQLDAIDVHTLQPDIYFIRFEFNTGISTVKLIKSE